MIYSERCKYAIRTLTYLAEGSGDELVRLSDVAEARDLPLQYTRKICRAMVREGLLRSSRGPKGGYALARPASEITLREIHEAVDGPIDLESCAVGLDPCTDETPCSLHETWKPLRESLERYLEETTLEHLARGRDAKRTRMEERDQDMEEAGARLSTHGRQAGG